MLFTEVQELPIQGVVLSNHALDHLSAGKVVISQDLLHMLAREQPRKIFLQENGRYAAYYRKKDGYRKLIIEIEKKAVIVSFMDCRELPRP